MRLDRIHFKWSIPRRTMDLRTLWEHSYVQVAAYVESTRPDVPPLVKWKDRKLAHWVQLQQATKQWKRLSAERRQKLIALNLMPCKFKHLKWDDRYQQALSIYKKKKPRSIWAYRKFDPTVYRWIKMQQFRWKFLSSIRHEKLLQMKVNAPENRRKSNPA